MDFKSFIEYHEDVLRAKHTTTLFRRRFSSEYGIRVPVAFKLYEKLKFNYNRNTPNIVKFRVGMSFLRRYLTEEHDASTFELSEQTIRTIRRNVVTEISMLNIVSFSMNFLTAAASI